jgi:hypothetical protein
MAPRLRERLAQKEDAMLQEAISQSMLVEGLATSLVPRTLVTNVVDASSALPPQEAEATTDRQASGGDVGAPQSIEEKGRRVSSRSRTNSNALDPSPSTQAAFPGTTSKPKTFKTPFRSSAKRNRKDAGLKTALEDLELQESVQTRLDEVLVAKRASKRLKSIPADKGLGSSLPKNQLRASTASITSRRSKSKNSGKTVEESSSQAEMQSSTSQLPVIGDNDEDPSFIPGRRPRLSQRSKNASKRYSLRHHNKTKLVSEVSLGAT